MQSPEEPRRVTRPDNRAAVIIGGILIVLGAISLIDNVFPWFSGLMWAAALAVAGVLIFGLYLTDRSQWWAMIPAYVLWAVAGLVFLTTVRLLRDEWVATYVLYSIGLPFVYVWTRNPRENWWALIPAYVMGAIGSMIALIGMGVLNDLLIPAYVMFAIAFPFLVVYLLNRSNWWALIPGGIMATIGMGFLLGSGAIELFVPAVLIVGGLFLLLRQFIPNRRAPAESVPAALTGPEADRAPEEVRR